MSPASGEVQAAPHLPHTGTTGGITPPWSRADHPCFSEELIRPSVLGYNLTHLPSSGGLVALQKLFQDTDLNLLPMKPAAKLIMTSVPAELDLL